MSVPRVILYLVCGTSALCSLGIVEDVSLTVASSAIAVIRRSKLYDKYVPEAEVKQCHDLF